MPERLTLELSTAQLEDFCRQVRARERSAADALRALTTLQAFINGHVTPATGQAARDLLAGYCDRLRTEVLNEAATTIRGALTRQSAPALAACLTRLSRSGFAEAVHIVLSTHTHEQRDAMRAWISDWLEAVARKSGNIPDAIDFRAAGVTPGEYQAMRDVLANL